ncbi:MAG: cell division/cell wall cluster transcriptional repressor MraZ [Candidatus Omnitrophica bacterium 4484_213]|nr:MAG: cell division/cell wall cluster transcriptional repressor MraZ [Candidatus Omnitrophica bacterium 4484_213]
MFYGEYKHSLDEKGRLTIPAEFRRLFKKNNISKIFITKGLDKCLFLFIEKEWRRQEEKFKALSFTKEEARKFNRIYFSGASELSWDNQGRVLIPLYLKDYAQIKKEVVVIGVSNRIELWSKANWKKFYADSLPRFEEIAERINET